MFGVKYPSFNVKGKSHYNTLLGFVCSVMLFSLFMVYASVKFDELINADNPDFSSIVTKNYYHEK